MYVCVCACRLNSMENCFVRKNKKKKLRNEKRKKMEIHLFDLLPACFLANKRIESIHILWRKFSHFTRLYVLYITKVFMICLPVNKYTYICISFAKMQIPLNVFDIY